LYETILNDSVYPKLAPGLMVNMKDPDSPALKAIGDEVWLPAMKHLERELPKDQKFLCGNKMTVHDYTIGHWLTNCFRNPNAWHKAMWNEWEKEKMPPRISKYLDDIVAELKEYWDKRNEEIPRGG
jgi:glutathione S-transferase